MDSLFSGFFVNLDATALLLFIVVFILTADYIKNRRLTGFPPGPTALPVVGNIFTLDHKRTHESMTELAGRYGDVYSMRMGQRWVVVLNGFEAVTQALVTQGDSFSDRPGLPLHDDTFRGLGVILSNGHMWKQQRRFALSTLKYFGFGKKSLEPVILEEFTYVREFDQQRLFIRVYIYFLSQCAGKPFNPHLIVNNTVANIICLLVFGHRFEYGDEQFKKLMKLFDQSFQLEVSVSTQLYNAFPQLMRRLPGPHQKYKRINEELKDFVRTEVKDHKQKWDPSDLRDFIDYYLKEIQTDDSTFDEECLIMSVLDLFAAGSETTSTTLRWAFLYMVKYPEIQERVQAEIDSVIGQSRPPSVDDRADLPYTDAVIHEIQRMGNIAPLSLPHVTNRDVHLRGHTIPKGVTIIPNLTSVLFDKREWKTPFTFNPGHFLNEEGKFVKPAAFIPFSAGKRLCLGENLARMELFLFFTSFMQRFTFSMPPGVKPVLDYRFGITLSPVHYEICAKPRHE
uniref:Cytochrome P450 2J2-like n=1 Tax=Sphaeramia orbicularis TaxID=375764 RepID=A0A672ZZ77_9TELE